MKRGAVRVSALTVALLWTCVDRSVAAGIGGPGERELLRIVSAHATGLVEISRFCLENGLYNDAERLQISARRLDPEAADFEALDAALTDKRIAVARGDERATRKSFLLSDDYARARQDMSRQEEELGGRITERLLDLAAELKARDRSEMARKALWQAFLLDPESRRLKKTAGPQLLDTFRDKQLAETGLSKLSLGEAIDDHDAELDDLRGKVVVWRSVSL